jgi:hypothetical protein
MTDDGGQTTEGARGKEHPPTADLRSAMLEARY